MVDDVTLTSSNIASNADTQALLLVVWTSSASSWPVCTVSTQRVGSAGMVALRG
jgi:hypothetical protein